MAGCAALRIRDPDHTVPILTFSTPDGAYLRRMTLVMAIAIVVLIAFGLGATKVSPSRSYREPQLP